MYFDASTTSRSPNYHHLYLYDWTEGQYIYQTFTEQVGVNKRTLGNEPYVIPGHACSVLLYVSNAQIQAPRRWFYSDCIEVYEN